MNYIYLPPNEGNTRTINCSLRLNPRKNVFNGPFANVSVNRRKFAGSIARCVANVPYDKRIDGKVVPVTTTPTGPQGLPKPNPVHVPVAHRTPDGAYHHRHSSRAQATFQS